MATHSGILAWKNLDGQRSLASLSDLKTHGVYTSGLLSALIASVATPLEDQGFGSCCRSKYSELLTLVCVYLSSPFSPQKGQVLCAVCRPHSNFPSGSLGGKPKNHSFYLLTTLIRSVIHPCPSTHTLYEYSQGDFIPWGPQG